MIKVERVYIDICDNFRYYLRLNNKRLKRCKLQRFFLYNKYKLLKKINYVALIKRRRKNFVIIYSDRDDKTIKRLEKIVLEEKERNVIISRKLLKITEGFDNKNKELKECIENNYNNKINYFTNIERVLADTLKQNNYILEQSRIYILIKEYSYVFEKHIISISKICNSVNIITLNIKDFYDLEKVIQEDIGASVTISNNTRKSVAKAKFIVNVDFNEREINRYNLSRRAIIFNLSQNKLLNLKGFDGIVINNVEFWEKDNSLSRMMDRRFGYVYDDDFIIIDLIGNNGKIKWKMY